MKRWCHYGLTLMMAGIMAGLLAACDQSEDAHHLRVGTIAGPESEIMRVAKAYAKTHFDLEIKVIEFNDYNTPNIALNDGSIDANVFQHQPFLDSVIHSHGYPLVSVGKTFVYPMALYSKKVKRIANIPNGALVAIPNDPTNEARALLLLEKAGLIELLGQNNNAQLTLHHITGNPKNLQIREIDAAQLPRVLPDVYLAAINTNYAIPAGLMPNRDGLLVESANSPYANVVVTKVENQDDPRIDQLLHSLHSPQVVFEAQRLFHQQAIPAWNTQKATE